VPITLRRNYCNSSPSLFTTNIGTIRPFVSGALNYSLNTLTNVVFNMYCRLTLLICLILVTISSVLAYVSSIVSHGAD